MLQHQAHATFSSGSHHSIRITPEPQHQAHATFSSGSHSNIRRTPQISGSHHSIRITSEPPHQAHAATSGTRHNIRRTPLFHQAHTTTSGARHKYQAHARATTSCSSHNMKGMRTPKSKCRSELFCSAAATLTFTNPPNC